VVSRSFCGRRRALAVSVASVSFSLSPATRDTPPPLVRLVRAHWFSAAAPPASTYALSVPGHHSRVPKAPLKVTVLTPPLISPVMHLAACDCSSECSTVRRGLSLRRLDALAPFTQTRPRHNACQVIPNLSSYPDRPLAP
jgi:hypothetical protein